MNDAARDGAVAAQAASARLSTGRARGPRAFAKLSRLSTPHLSRVALRILTSASAAEDILQKTGSASDHADDYDAAKDSP